MPPKRTPVTLYAALLATVEGGDEGARVRTLRRRLRQPAAAWPPELREVVDGAGVGVGYLTRGLLSIHRFAPEVRRALEAGLPFAGARLVSGLPTAAPSEEPLAERVAEALLARTLPRGGETWWT